MAFHLGIDVIFDVGFFSTAMWLAYVAFLPPETADSVVEWIHDRLPWRRERAADDGADDGDPSASTVPLPVEPAE